MVAFSDTSQQSDMTEAIEVQRLSHDSIDLPQVAALHAECLPGTLTSSRGAKTIAGLYRLMLGRNHIIYVAHSANKVVGGLVVTKANARSCAALLVSHRPWTWLLVLGRLGPMSLLRQVTDLLSLRTRSNKMKPHDYINALFVSEGCRRMGVATQLLNRCFVESVLENVGLAVDTEIINQSALRLYRSNGFSEKYWTKHSALLTKGVG